MISSTEVRRRIREVKERAQQELDGQLFENGPMTQNNQNQEQIIKHNQAILSASYFYEIGGLVTKSTI